MDFLGSGMTGSQVGKDCIVGLICSYLAIRICRLTGKECKFEDMQKQNSVAMAALFSAAKHRKIYDTLQLVPWR